MNRFAKLSPEPMPVLPNGLAENIELKTARTIERERKEFKRDRIGHNGHGKGSRVTYLAHGKGWVMCRHPGCIPFAVTEKEWLAFPYWER